MRQQWVKELGIAERYCVVCGTKFLPKRQSTQTCGEKCRRRWRYLSGNENTKQRYAALSGNWERYFRRLINKRDRRETLSVDDLLEVHQRQDGKCALTGETLTCKLVHGKRQWTNASIDRIVPEKGYVPDNIQLVCAAVKIGRAHV